VGSCSFLSPSELPNQHYDRLSCSYTLHQDIDRFIVKTPSVLMHATVVSWMLFMLNDNPDTVILMMGTGRFF
jgi:hypothetical protein